MSSFSSEQAQGALLQTRPAALAHREAHECASALGVGDVAGCYQSYSAALSWEDRWFCLEHIARMSTIGGAQPSAEVASLPIDASLVDAWVDGWPDHPLPLLIRAAIGALNGVHGEADLDVLRRLDPGNPLVPGLKAVVRSESGVGEAEEALGEMLALEPLYQPHATFLRCLGPNGQGDTETMVAFARSVDEVVPAGSPLRSMLPLAAIEVILAEQPEDHLACLDDYGLRASIMMAAGQSVFHPEFVGLPSIPGIKATTAFMVALELLGEDDLALMLHRRLDGTFADWPLSLIAEPTMAGWLELGRHMTQNSGTAAAAGGRG